MLSKEKHQLIMGQIIKDIYTDIEISHLLGFKGGTCAYFFYDLPRFSVDLDFDLLNVNEDNKNLVFEKIINILGKYGEVKNQYIKRYTIFALVSYDDSDHNIKVEINLRNLVENIENCYNIKEYFGISVNVAKKDYMFAGKLLALTLRSKTAIRDVYDIHYFLKNNWDINEGLIKQQTAKDKKEYLTDCIKFIEGIKDNQLLQGLGEMLENSAEKDWVKKHLKTETVFLLKNYKSVLK